MRMLVVIAVAAACGNHGEHHASTGSAGSAAAIVIVDAGPADPPVALGSDGFPLACGTWRAALDKLETCTAMPANARESLKSIYLSESKNWGQLPVDDKKRLGPICQAGADSVLKGAKATCGW